MNPVAGRGRGGWVAEQVVPQLQRAGLTVRRLEGGTGEEAAELAAAAVRDGADAFVVVGGDGMVHLALQALAGTDVPLGIVPCGTGNDVARMLGLSRKDPRRAANTVIAGRTQSLDVADAAGTRVATVVATGFDSRVNERANAMSWPSGQMRYNLATLAVLRVFEPIRYTLELDGVSCELDAMLVAIGNGPSYGGGLQICAGAAPDDGLLDVVVIKPVSKSELVRVYPRLFTGGHVRHPAYERHRVRVVSVAAADVVAYGDGERLGPLPLTVRVVPDAVRVFVPEPPTVGS